MKRNRFGIWVCCALSVYVLLALLQFDYAQQDVRNLQLQRLEQKLLNQSARIENLFGRNRQTAVFLSEVPPMQGIIRALENGGTDPLDGTRLKDWKSRLQTIFFALLKASPDITQIRYMENRSGLELVRVDRDHGAVRITPENQLQNKQSRGYFSVASQLKPGEIYISPIELNREHGQIQFPKNPTYRVAVATYNQEQQNFGFLIINYDARVLLQNVQDDQWPGQSYLLNAQQQFLQHPREQHNFAFELGGHQPDWNSQFGRPLPENSREILEYRNESGEDILVRSSLQQLSGGNHAHHLYLVQALPAAVIFAESLKQFTLYQLVSFVFLLAALLIIGFYHKSLLARTRASELDSLYKTIYAASSEAIITLDARGRVVNCNPAAEHLLRQRSSHMEGSPLLRHLALEDMDEAHNLEQLIHESIRGSLVSPLEVRTWDEYDDQHLFLRIQVNAIGSGNSKQQVALMILDVTDSVNARITLENNNQKLEQQIRERTADLEKALSAAQQASVAKGQFLATMSHEIRTPMNGIFGMLALLHKDPLSNRQIKHLAMAETSVRNLTTLINDILDFSKIDAGKLELNYRDIDLFPLLHSISASISVTAGKKNLPLLTELSGLRVSAVQADDNRLAQVINNLLSNAIKFTRQGYVKLTASSQPAADGQVDVHIRVEDTGIGIDSDQLDTIFNAFTQEDASISRRFGGTGLGLSISRQLVEMMGGSISVDSEKGRGSCFTVSLQLQAAANHQAPLTLGLSQAERALVSLPLREEAEIVRQALEEYFHIPAATCSVQELDEYRVLDSPGSASIFITGSSNPAATRLAAQCRQLQGETAPVVIVLDEHLDKGQPIQLDTGMVLMDRPVSPYSLYSALSSMKAARDPAGEAAASGASTPAALATCGTPALGQHTLLVVDDNQINREVLIGLLSESGARIIEAADGREAIARLASSASSPVSLVLMDCQMPVMDGYEATRLIRDGEAGEDCRRLPVIALTASAMAGERERCMAAGMNDYLSKPVEQESLLQALDKWILPFKASGLMPATEMPAVEAHPRHTRPTDSPEQTELAVWDRQTALLRLNNKQDLLDRILQMYLESTPKSMSALKQQLADDERRLLRESGHSLKGISNSIGAVRIAEMARQIELHAESAETEDLAAMVARLDFALDEFRLLVTNDGQATSQSQTA